MEEAVFHVQGSAPEPYIVHFKRDGKNLRARCTCPAGVVGQYCKHRMRILEGSAEAIVSGNDADVAKITAWLSGSDVELAIGQLRDAEYRLEVAKREISSLKKKLAKALQD